MFLRKDQDNHLYYFPLGKIFDGYKLDRAEDITKVKNVLQTQQILLILSLVMPFNMKHSNITGMKGVVSLLVVYFIVHIGTSFQAVRKLKKSNVTWILTEAYTEPAKPVTLKGLIFCIAGMIFFILLACYLSFYTSKGSPLLAWITISFCSVIIFITVKKIIKREYETDIPK